jgi:hypothetical protein
VARVRPAATAPAVGQPRLSVTRCTVVEVEGGGVTDTGPLTKISVYMITPS